MPPAGPSGAGQPELVTACQARCRVRELLARLATLKYGAIPGMSMGQRLAAFFLILLDNEKVENAVDALGAKPPKPEFDPSAEPTLEGLNEVRDCP